MKHASYVYSAYSFLKTLSKDEVLQVGNLMSNGNPIPSFDEQLLINLCEDASKIFQKEDNILELNGDVIIVGDIHGSFHDLLRILNFSQKDSGSQVLFLGDYVDRGSFSLECITLLFTLKILEPNRYFLLRGNHEFDSIAKLYGFKKEILNYHNPKKTEQVIMKREIKQEKIDLNFDDDDEYEEDIKEKVDPIEKVDLCDDYFANHVNINCYKYTEKLYNAFMKAFSYLPLCSIVNKTSFCIHGGITPLIEKVKDIRSIKRPIFDFDDNKLLEDLVWSDPSQNSNELYHKNTRGRGNSFNGVAVITFLKRNNLKRLIRGHEYIQDGVGKLFNEKCITVFSCSSYKSDMGNSSGILKVSQKDDSVEPIVFQPLHRLEKYDANYFKVQMFNSHQQNRKITEYKSGFLSASLYSIDHKKTHINYSKSEPKKNFLGRGMILKSGPRKKNICNNSNASLFINQPQIVSPKINNASCMIFSKYRNLCNIKENYLRDTSIDEEQIELKSLI